MMAEKERKEVLEAMLYIVEASSSNVILRLSQLLSASVPASSADNWDVMVKSSLVLACSYLLTSTEVSAMARIAVDDFILRSKDDPGKPFSSESAAVSFSFWLLLVGKLVEHRGLSKRSIGMITSIVYPQMLLLPRFVNFLLIQDLFLFVCVYVGQRDAQRGGVGDSSL
mmetsp:Transcript_23768/g.34858  ORF Transcript_23768/g.34858 Transcript_23768/m.34858 type:complete len:169 (+) Transcript_23768:903-1409(+)